MKNQALEMHGPGAMETTDYREEISLRGCLGWLTAITPRGRAREEAEWRFMDAERLDHRSLESLGEECHGC
jgi:hypothetical protein